MTKIGHLLAPYPG